jgi:hypothetical protein
MTAKVKAWMLASLLLSACASEEPLASEVQAAGGNADAVVCCKELFPPGKLRGQCISQAAKGLGPCVIDAGVPAEVPDAGVPDEVPDAGVVVDAEVPVEIIDAAVVPVP